MEGERWPVEARQILLVDDDPIVRSALEDFLNELGYRVLVAANGEEAIAILALTHEPIRLLITDIRMPVMDGISLIRVVRQNFAELPIAIISGFADDAETATADDRHIVHFHKPMDFTEIELFLSRL